MPKTKQNGKSIDDKYVVIIDNKEFIRYPGILLMAHEQGLKSIVVELIQIPVKENNNLAICKATAVMNDDMTFVDVGDASPQNCSNRVAKHLIRMASTRASARALRNAVGLGICSVEELENYSDTENYKQPEQKEEQKSRKTSAQNQKKDEKSAKTEQKSVEKPESAGQSEKKSDKTSTNQPAMSAAQRNAIYNLSKRRGIEEAELEHMAIETYSKPLEDLSSKESAEFIRRLQTAA
ncbi:hypothetical protein ACFL5P_00510 [candidate division KSB1 bacterium]